jgi:hypothetical protein
MTNTISYFNEDLKRGKQKANHELSQTKQDKMYVNEELLGQKHCSKKENITANQFYRRPNQTHNNFLPACKRNLVSRGNASQSNTNNVMMFNNQTFKDTAASYIKYPTSNIQKIKPYLHTSGGKQIKITDLSATEGYTKLKKQNKDAHY